MKPGAIGPNPFGGTNDQVRMNPPVGSADLVEPAGPTDPEISVLSVQTTEGRPIAVLANYSLHYVGTGGRDLDISADYYGMVAAKLERRLGTQDTKPPFVAMLCNGTSGDINNINFRQAQPPKAPYEQADKVAEIVAREIERVYGLLSYQERVAVGARQAELRLGVRRPAPDELARARGILSKAGKRELKGYEEVYARETVLMSEYPAEVAVLVQALRIGGLGIAAIPCEVFAETGLAIKQKSPFGQSFTIELANGYNGYLPTPEQHRWGGYETWRARSSYLEVDAATKIFDRLMGLFGDLRAGDGTPRRTAQAR